MSTIASTASPSVSFQGASGAAVLRLMPGPEGVLVGGFSDGRIVLWSQWDGEQLDAGRVHGAPSHMLFDGQKLAVASELGDVQTFDLTVFQRPWCDVLREVWSGVPIVLEHGRPAVRPPPAEHPCNVGR